MTESGPGRPEFKPSRAQRKKVERLVYSGMRQVDIARAIGISKPTLTKHFEEELATGLAKQRAAVVEMLFDSAKDGNVSAMRKLEEMGRIAGAEAALAAEPDQHATPKLGKKEEAEEVAKTAGAGSEWGDDLMTPGTRPN